MKTYKIELIKIGRDDYSETIVMNFLSMKQASQYAIDEVGKHLMSSGITMSCQDGKTFTVFAGFRNVGTVKIIESELKIKLKKKVIKGKKNKMVKKFRVLLTRYPQEYIIEADNKETAITKAKEECSFSVWESEVEKIDGKN